MASPQSWGLYQIYWGDAAFFPLLDKELKTYSNHPPSYVLYFRDLKRGYQAHTLKKLQERGLTAVISLELCIWGRCDKNFLKDILSGEYDAFFKTWGEEARKHGVPFLLRFGFEMNGDWFSWGEQPESFVRAWKRAYDLMEGPDGNPYIDWVFSPNVLWGKRSFESDFKPYYPGDNYVDIVGLDGYNFGNDHSPYHSWRSYDQIFDKSLAAIARFDKPLIITEIGSAHGPEKAEWMSDALKKMTADERVEAFIYFNYDKRSENEPNWRIDSDEQSLNTFLNWCEEQSSLQ